MTKGVDLLDLDKLRKEVEGCLANQFNDQAIIFSIKKAQR